jgi:predicted dehydrogenase
MAVLDAGKPVYVEKPMSINAASATRMANAAKEKNIKLVVAHYRRQQPVFKKIKQLLAEKIIGEVRLVRSELYKPCLSAEELRVPKLAWRVDPSVAGGGLFHDLAPHQLDLMIYFFGEPLSASGIALNQSELYPADDLVVGTILFKSQIVFDGAWCFSTSKNDERDICEIVGERGSIRFPFFDHKLITVTVNGKAEEIAFEPLQHVQQPMIEKIVEYFLDEGPNPNTGDEGAMVMKLIDDFTSK